MAYQAPRVIRFGTLRQLTLSGWGQGQGQDPTSEFTRVYTGRLPELYPSYS